ncbi:hypothetical protein FACS1894106_1850 [Spirochaetia bacterium]|nr:hypothetical protein FACS1894106_1850 [Spirochaetia bacterium]
MKNKKWNKAFLLGVSAAVLAFGLVLMGCEVEPPEDPDITYTVTANGESDVTTSTELTFTFSKSVDYLFTSEITVTNGTGAVTTGYLTSTSGTTLTLPINSVTTQGDVSISISADGIESGAKTVAVYKALPTVYITTATQTGGASGTADSTAIDFTLGEELSDLTLAQMVITNETGAAEKGTGWTHTAGTTSYSLTLASVTTPGTIFLSGTHPRMTSSSGKTVTVHKNGVVTGGGSTKALALPLTADTWAESTVYSTAYNSSQDVVWYKFEATTGTTYRVWWNDSLQGSSTKTADIKVYKTEGSGSETSSVDSGYTSAGYTVSGFTGTVYLRVVTDSSTSTSTGTWSNRGGTFGIVYSTSTICPAL